MTKVINYLFITCIVIIGLLLNCCANNAMPHPIINENIHHLKNATLNTKNNAISKQESSALWWEGFHDKTLNEMIIVALKNNQDIKTANQNLIVANQNLQRIKMNWVPNINLGGSATIGQTFNNGNNSSNALLSSNNNYNFYTASIMPTYSVNILKQLKEQDLAVANINIANTTKLTVKISLITQILNAYFGLLTLNKQLIIQNNIIQILNELLTITTMQYDNGLATLIDVNNCQIQLTKAKMAIPNILQNIAINKNILRVLVDSDMRKYFESQNVSDSFADNQYAHMLPNALSSKVIYARPDIMIAEEELKIANINIDIARANFFPQLALTTPIGGYNAQLGNLFNNGGNFWAMQIMMNIPILNLGLYELIKQQKAQYYINYYQYIKTVEYAFMDVNNNLSNYENIENLQKEAHNNYNSINANYQHIVLQYELGYINHLQKLLHKIELENAKINLIQLHLEKLQAIALFYQAIAYNY